MSKILRGCRAFWLTFDGENFTLIGKDSDDLSIETNPDTEQTKNVLEETTFNHNGYTPSLSVDYLARTEDSIYEHIQKIADGLLVGDDEITATLIVATLTDAVKDSDIKTLTGEGFSVPAKIVVDSDGGSTSGYSIPFTAYESGNRIQGSVSVTKRVPTFTEADTLAVQASTPVKVSSKSAAEAGNK